MKYSEFRDSDVVPSTISPLRPREAECSGDRSGRSPSEKNVRIDLPSITSGWYLRDHGHVEPA